MANTNNPGFKPAFNLVGPKIATLRFSIAAASGTACYVGDLVSAVNTGTITPSTADDGITVVGVVVALYDSDGVAIGSPGSSVSTKYLPASTAGYADVALANDSNVFIAQSTASLAAADVFTTTNHVATAGNTTKATSGHVLNGTDQNTGKQVMILGKVGSPGNDWDAAYTDVYVKFTEGMFCGSDTAMDGV